MYHYRVLVKPFIVIGMLPLFFSGCSASKPVEATLVPAVDITDSTLKETVARVNGKDITLAELKRAKKIIISGQPGTQIPPYLQKEFETQTLNQLISSELLFQAGQKLELKNVEKQADERMTKIKSGFPDEKDYARELTNIGMDEKMLRDYTRRDLVIANFVETVIASKVTVTDEEIKKYYDQNPDKFRQSEQVRASHILLGTAPTMSNEEKKKMREKADSLHAELLKGADFAKLAREHSTCPSGKQGGDLGYFGKGKMVPAFDQAAFALKPGDVSNVVESTFGYHIIKLDDRIKAETVPLSTASEKLKDFLKTQKINAAINEFVGEARKTAKIDILLK